MTQRCEVKGVCKLIFEDVQNLISCKHMTFGISMLLWIYYILETLKLVKFLVGGQLDDLDFGLSEDVEALDVRGRHLQLWHSTWVLSK